MLLKEMYSETTPKLKYPDKHNDSVTRTIRLDREVDEMFQEMAIRERVSVNKLVSKALIRYGEWEVYAERLGFVSIGGKVLMRLFNNLTDEEARDLGRDFGNNGGPDLVNFYFRKYDYNTVMQTLALLGHTYARLYTFERSISRDTDILIFKHGMGPRASGYLAEVVKGLLAKLNLKTEIMETQDQVVVTILNRQKPIAPANSR